MWFDSWQDVLQVGLVGLAAYGVTVVALRVTGKRTLAQLNAFDFVVTVALGSVLATTVLSTETSLVDGASALLVLALAQVALAWLASRLPIVRNAATSSPALLVHRGRLDDRALRENRPTESEVRQAVRSSGRGTLSGVGAVVLETDGTLSVIGQDALGDGWALHDLPGLGRGEAA